MGLNMCLLAPTHLLLLSRFSRVSSTWGFVSFGIRETTSIGRNEESLSLSLSIGKTIKKLTPIEAKQGLML